MASASGSSSGGRKGHQRRRQPKDADSDRPAAGSITDVESEEHLRALLTAAGDALVVVCASEPGHTTEGPNQCTPCMMMMHVYQGVAAQREHHSAVFLHIPDNLALVRSYGVAGPGPGSHVPSVLFFRRGTLLERSSTEDAEAAYDGKDVEWRTALKRLLAPLSAGAGAVGAASGAAASVPAASCAGSAPVVESAVARAPVDAIPPRAGDAIHGVVANHKITALKELFLAGTITFEQLLAGFATIH